MKRRVSGALMGAVLSGLLAAAPAGAATASPLAGSWSGTMKATSPSGGGFSSYNYALTIFSGGRKGTWYLSSTCHGSLTFIANGGGYARFQEHLGAGSTCLGNGIDQLQRRGANLFDSFQSHAGAAYNSTGSLHKVV